jgi:hypothetical protein
MAYQNLEWVFIVVLEAGQAGGTLRMDTTFVDYAGGTGQMVGPLLSISYFPDFCHLVRS